MLIALVSRDNGAGLSVDMSLLDDMLTRAGHAVTRVDWRADAMPAADVAMFLELWSPRLARCARSTVGLFNLEWFQQSWVRDLPRITQLWSKSIEAQMIYQRLHVGHRATLTGFLGRDFYDPSVPRETRVLHVRGKSDFKNTQAVVEAWRRDPKLPPLTIISSTPLEAPHYVRVLHNLDHDQLRHEMNSHEIHLCPSRTEGWGHYIAEALSVGALVVTTDASPMHEHVRPEWGILVPPASSQRYGLVSAHGMSARLIRQAVVQAKSTRPAQRAQMAERARAHFLTRNEQFQTVAVELLERIQHAFVGDSQGGAGGVREDEGQHVPRHLRNRQHPRRGGHVPGE